MLADEESNSHQNDSLTGLLGQNKGKEHSPFCGFLFCIADRHFCMSLTLILCFFLIGMQRPKTTARCTNFLWWFVQKPNATKDVARKSVSAVSKIKPCFAWRQQNLWVKQHDKQSLKPLAWWATHTLSFVISKEKRSRKQSPNESLFKAWDLIHCFAKILFWFCSKIYSQVFRLNSQGDDNTRPHFLLRKTNTDESSHHAKKQLHARLVYMFSLMFLSSFSYSALSSLQCVCSFSPSVLYRPT